MPLLVRRLRASAPLVDRAAGEIALDVAQEAAAQRPAGGAMLVLGEAGYGKTTVALARLAHLHGARSGALRALVLVPSDGLAEATSRALVRRGVDVPVRTFDRWVVHHARRTFADLPKRRSVGASAVVARMKRDPALLPLVAARASAPPGVVDDDFDAPPPKTNAHAHRGDLQHLFGDRIAMETLARAMTPPASARGVDAILEHTRVQFLERTERAWAHVDRARLLAADRRSLDAGTATEDADSFDVEDAAVMFAIDRLRAEGHGAAPSPTPRYDLIVIDEAQEFAPIELQLIGCCLAPEATLVVAGDADQQLDPTTAFGGWAATMRALGVDAWETVTLAVGYRCAEETMTLARAIRDSAPIAAHAVVPPVSSFTSDAARDAWVVDEAVSLAERDPHATLFVAARTPATARRLARAIQSRTPCRLALDGRFPRHRGADVTTVDMLRGLEADFVIVPDVDAETYPEGGASRRALYVALTRARERVAIGFVGAPSRLLAGTAR